MKNKELVASSDTRYLLMCKWMGYNLFILLPRQKTKWARFTTTTNPTIQIRITMASCIWTCSTFTIITKSIRVEFRQWLLRWMTQHWCKLRRSLTAATHLASMLSSPTPMKPSRLTSSTHRTPRLSLMRPSSSPSLARDRTIGENHKVSW